MQDSWWQCSVRDLMILSVLILIDIDILVLHILRVDARGQDSILELECILGNSSLNVSM